MGGTGTVVNVVGYFAAAFGPRLFGVEQSLSAAGMIAVVAGLLLAAAVALGPRHGVLGRRLRTRSLAQPA